MPPSGDPASGASSLGQCATGSCRHCPAGRLGWSAPCRRRRAWLRLLTPRCCRMTALVVPADRIAEEVVVGCAVATVHGAALVGERLSTEDFYWPRHRALLRAAVGVVGVSDEEVRIRLCGAGADVPEAAVAELVRRRPVMFDATGSSARRVLEAARRRRLMHVCEAAYRRIAEGGTPEEALELLRAAS